MKLKDLHVNIVLFVLTLLASGVYLLTQGVTESTLVVSCSLLVVLLVVLGVVLWICKTTVRALPGYAAVWTMLYFFLPSAANISNSVEQLGGYILPQFFSNLSGVFLVLVLAVVARFIFGKLDKKNGHPLFIVLRYLCIFVIMAVITIDIFLSMTGSPAGGLFDYIRLLSNNFIRRVVVAGPLFFGGLCMCQELLETLLGTRKSHMAAFIWLTVMFCLVPTLCSAGNPAAISRLPNILLGSEMRVHGVILMVALGVLLLLKNVDGDEWDETRKGFPHQILAFEFFAWSAYSLLTLVWPQFLHVSVFLFGVPLSALLYTFLRRFYGSTLPLMQRENNAFLAAFWAVDLVLLLAIGRSLSLRPRYLLLLAVLAALRYVCRVLTSEANRRLVMQCFWGVASLVLLAFAWWDLGVVLEDRLRLVVLLATSVFWCVICGSLARVSRNSSQVYGDEYVLSDRVITYIPVVLGGLTLILLLFL